VAVAAVAAGRFRRLSEPARRALIGPMLDCLDATTSPPVGATVAYELGVTVDWMDGEQLERLRRGAERWVQHRDGSWLDDTLRRVREARLSSPP